MVRNILFYRQGKLVSILLFSLLWIGFLADSVNSDENNSHADLKCATCHSIQKKLQVKRKICLTCHFSIQDNNYLELLNFHKDDNRLCTDCHSFHDTKYLHADSVKFQFDFSLESSTATCFACHQTNSFLSNLSDGHQEARKLYHSELPTEYSMTPSQTCMACHANNQNDFELTFNVDDMPVINNHASHPYEIEIVRGEGNSNNHIKSEIAPNIKLFDNRIECQTCHTLTSENEFLVSNSENQSDFCTGCHEHNGNNIDLVSTQ